ncbi:MAG: VPLPA-CTERM sorting domain-containing protein [Pseudomonadota bacterium]
MATNVSAATMINIETFSVADYQSAVGGVSVLSVEDFEGFDLNAGPTPNSYQSPAISTAVGDFSVSPGSLPGSGGTVTNPNPDLDGNQLAVRNGNVFGRSDSTKLVDETQPGASQFLDSNDVAEFQWDAKLPGDALFNTLIWVMSDATDQGAKLTITAGEDMATADLFPKLPNGNRQIVKVTFMTAVDQASLFFENTKKNDGLSIDDVAAGLAPVPLPAPILLLGAGLAGLGLMRRKTSA